jgi:hypothetical protein
MMQYAMCVPNSAHLVPSSPFPPSQERRGSRSSHDAEFPIQKRRCRRHRRARRSCRRRPRCNNAPYNTKLIAHLLLLERARITWEGSIPIRFRVEGRGCAVVCDSSWYRVVRCGRSEGFDFGCDGCARRLVGGAEGLGEGAVGKVAVDEDAGSPA